ncbi:MAG: RNA polymerase sigma factor [Fimbriiglobus sp.]
MNADDRHHIDLCLAGDPEAFTFLVLKYQDRLFNSVLRITDNAEDAADAVQDAFINAYQSLASFKGDAEFFTWLYRIAFNTAVTIRRKRKNAVSLEARRGSDPTIDPVDPSDETRPGAAMERSEDETALMAALNRLSPEHRTVLVLKDIDGMKYEEIAEVMGIAIGTVRSRIHRARSELKDLLEANFGNQSPVETSKGEK